MEGDFEGYREKIEAVVGNLDNRDAPLRAFLICPVRGHSPEETRSLVNYLEEELGLDVHWPHRDTNQEDETGLRICEQNRAAIQGAGVVLGVFPEGEDSLGSHFDLGVAYGSRKPYVPLVLPKPTEGKSFPNMMRAWYKEEINNI